MGSFFVKYFYGNYFLHINKDNIFFIPKLRGNIKNPKLLDSEKSSE